MSSTTLRRRAAVPRPKRRAAPPAKRRPRRRRRPGGRGEPAFACASCPSSPACPRTIAARPRRALAVAGLRPGRGGGGFRRPHERGVLRRRGRGPRGGAHRARLRGDPQRPRRRLLLRRARGDRRGRALGQRHRAPAHAALRRAGGGLHGGRARLARGRAAADAHAGRAPAGQGRAPARIHGAAGAPAADGGAAPLVARPRRRRARPEPAAAAARARRAHRDAPRDRVAGDGRDGPLRPAHGRPPRHRPAQAGRAASRDRSAAARRGAETRSEGCSRPGRGQVPRRASPSSPAQRTRAVGPYASHGRAPVRHYPVLRPRRLHGAFGAAGPGRPAGPPGALPAPGHGIIERWGGFVASFQGDGVLAFFGYPTAHETDAERGIRAALELVERVPGLPAPAADARSRPFPSGSACTPAWW